MFRLVERECKKHFQHIIVICPTSWIRQDVSVCLIEVTNSLRHTSEQGHRAIIRKQLVQQDKPFNNANRKPPVVINSYPENDKLHN